jgi:hypothetical protein
MQLKASKVPSDAHVYYLDETSKGNGIIVVSLIYNAKSEDVAYPESAAIMDSVVVW